MCRGLSMATPRFVIIVITALSVSTLMGATWENRVLAETPTLTLNGGSTNNNPPPTLTYTTTHHNRQITRVIRMGLRPNDNEMSLPFISLVAVALTPSNQRTSSTKRLRRQSQQQRSLQLHPNAYPDPSSSSPYPIITTHNTNHDNRKPVHQHHLHNQQEHLLLADFSSLDLSSATNKFIRPRARVTHGHNILPFPGSLSSQESTISSGGGGTDTQKLLFDAKFQSPSSSSLAAAVVNTIRCSCDTGDCASNSENACLTSGMCYTQFLDRGDGSRKLIRGCISESTPLLCENKPPRASGSRWPWPYLRCCNSDMCNAGGLTIPPSHLGSIASVNSSIPEKENSHHHIRPHQISNENIITLDELHETTLSNHERTTHVSGDKELSPGIISFFVGSAVYVVVLSGLGFVKFFLWRRKQNQEACYYRKDLEQEVEVDEDGGDHNETCLSSPVNTEETIDYEPNQISISIPCHHYQFQQSHDHHDLSSCVSASVPTSAIRLTATASKMKSVGGPVSTKSTSVSLKSPTSTTISTEIGEM